MAYDYVILTPQERLSIVREQLRALETQQQRFEVDPAAAPADVNFEERLAEVRKVYDDLVKEAAKS